MRYGREDSYGDEGNYLDDFAVYDGAAAYQPPASSFAVMPPAAQPAQHPR